MTDDGKECSLCGESQTTIRASQRTDDPIYCFDGYADYPTHRFSNRVPSCAAATGWKRRGTASAGRA